MKNFQVTPASVRDDPNSPGLSIPRSYGVWELSPNTGTRKYRIGNYPVRGVELAREYRTAKLIAIYTRRDSAKEHADGLNGKK